MSAGQDLSERRRPGRCRQDRPRPTSSSSSFPSRAYRQGPQGMTDERSTERTARRAATPVHAARPPWAPPQPRPPPGRRRGRAAGRGAPGVVRGRDRLAQLRAADARGTPRTGRPRRLLDLHLRQLAPTLPYVRAWAAKYADAGLTVVGVHTPEFGFERDLDNIVAQSRNFGVEYPSRSTATTASGAPSQPLLAGGVPRRRRGTDPLPPLRRGGVRDDRDGHPAAAARRRRGRTSTRTWSRSSRAAWRSPPTGGRCRSPETYTGYGQSTGFASDDIAAFDRPHAYAARPRLPLNYWDLSGNWTVARHAAILNEPGGRIAFQFHARDVNLVMGPASKGAVDPVPGLPRWPGRGRRHGTDVEPDGGGIVDEQRTYQLIRQTGSDRRPPVRDRVPRRRRRGLLLHLRLRVRLLVASQVARRSDTRATAVPVLRPAAWIAPMTTSSTRTIRPPPHRHLPPVDRVPYGQGRRAPRSTAPRRWPRPASRLVRVAKTIPGLTSMEERSELPGRAVRPGRPPDRCHRKGRGSASGGRQGSSASPRMRGHRRSEVVGDRARATSARRATSTSSSPIPLAPGTREGRIDDPLARIRMLNGPFPQGVAPWQDPDPPNLLT